MGVQTLGPLLHYTVPYYSLYYSSCFTWERTAYTESSHCGIKPALSRAGEK